MPEHTDKGGAIERYAEPLSYINGKPTRGQLHQAVYIDGERIPELSHPVGSPAPWATVLKYEETIWLP